MNPTPNPVRTTALTAQTWPIAAAMMPFGATTPERWESDLAGAADAGFDAIDLTDTWLRVGDLEPVQLEEFTAALGRTGLAARSMSLIRRSVIDAQHGDDNLAYSHRSIDAAAELDVAVVSVGLHQALTPLQQQQLWFWTEQGHVDRDDPELFRLAAARFRELGEHAARLGMLLSLELYEDTFLGTAESAVRLVEEIGLDSVGLNPDVGNLIRVHRPVERGEELYAKMLPYSNFWHIKSYSRSEDVARGIYVTLPSPLETGVIDHRRVMSLALEHGFQGVLCAEHYGGDGLSVSASNRDYLRRRILPKNAVPIGASRVRQQWERKH